jgi:hypothetical protein
MFIFGVRIYLDSIPSVANPTDMGLYSMGVSNSELRWVETDIAAYSPAETWKAGLMLPEGLGNIDESADWSEGGRMPRVGGSSVAVSNAVSIGGSITQLDRALDDANIRLSGLRAEIMEFEVGVDGLVDPAGRVLFRGICQEPTWSETQLTIPLETAQLKRKINLSTLIDGTAFPQSTPDVRGSMVPMTFGELRPPVQGDEIYAKMLRTADQQTTFALYIDNLVNTAENIRLCRDSIDLLGISAFPVVGNDGNVPPVIYHIKVGRTESDITWTKDGDPQYTGILMLDDWKDMEILVIDGIGAGQRRRIDTAGVNLDIDRTIVKISTKRYFETTLVGSATGSDDEDDGKNSWVSIVHLARQYRADMWPCAGFVAQNGDPMVADGIEPYAYAEAQSIKLDAVDGALLPQSKKLRFIRLPLYSYADTVDVNHNTVEIDLNFATDDPDDIDSFTIIPPYRVGLIGDDPLNATWVDPDLLPAGFVYMRPGLYLSPAYGNVNLELLQPLTNTYLRDGAFASTVRVSITVPGAGHLEQHDVAVALEIELPTWPAELDGADGVYLGLSLDNQGMFNDGEGVSTFLVGRRRWMGSMTEAIKKQTNDQGIIRALIDCLPDFYYASNPPDTRNKNFFVDVNWVRDDEFITWHLHGWKNFSLDLNSCDEDKYKSVKRVGLFITWPAGVYGPITETFDTVIWQIALMFRKRISIQGAIYTPMRGRIFNSTWGARRTATDMIADPVDIAEHILRLQNWSEVGENRDWGHEYPAAPLIDVSTNEGGLEYAGFAPLRDLRPARQVLRYDEAWSDALLQSLCRDFFLCQYQDPSTGNERLAWIGSTALTTPATTITLADILGDIGAVEFPGVKGIFCEPYIKYAKNNATSDYTKIIRIINAGAATYSAAYVVGLSGATAELAWTRCHALYLAYRQIEPCPDSLAESPWIVRDEDALWKLDTWLTWMGAVTTDGRPSGVVFQPRKRIGFAVPYSLGKTWHLGQHHLLQLPHQTNNQAIEFVIEKITRNVTPGQEKVSVQVVLYGDTTGIEIYVQDTFTSGTLLLDWLDNMDLQGVSGGGPDIEKIM